MTMAVVTVYNNDNKNVLTKWRQCCTMGYCLYSIGGFADFAIKPYLGTLLTTRGRFKIGKLILTWFWYQYPALWVSLEFT